MKNYRTAPSAMFVAGIVFTFIGIIFLPIGILLRGEDQLFFYVFGFLGAVMLGVGLALLIIWHRRYQTENKVILQGNYVIARITNITRDYSVSINGVNPWVIECDFSDPDTGIIHTFRSKNLMEDPSNRLKSNEVKVYINPEDLDEYYVDLNSAIMKTVVH